MVQNWIDVATDKQIEIRESERLASSCPFLYVWNGHRFVYVTDVLGVGPLGELAPDGTRVKPYSGGVGAPAQSGARFSEATTFFS